VNIKIIQTGKLIDPWEIKAIEYDKRRRSLRINMRNTNETIWVDNFDSHKLGYGVYHMLGTLLSYYNLTPLEVENLTTHANYPLVNKYKDLILLKEFWDFKINRTIDNIVERAIYLYVDVAPVKNNKY
jgi:hypothetical protein